MCSFPFANEKASGSSRGLQISSHGCCVLYNRRKFKLIEREIITFDQEGVTFLAKKSVGIIVVLGLRGPSDMCDKMIIVCTTHLVFGKNHQKTRVLQLLHILKCLKNKSTLYNDPGIVFCGDFNVKPKSPVIKYLLGKLSLSSLLSDYFDNAQTVGAELGDSDFAFESAYQLPQHVAEGEINGHQICDFTTCVGHDPNYVDYIFYGWRVCENRDQKDAFKNGGCLELEAKAPVPLPTFFCSSDHLPLLCRLCLLFPSLL